MQCIDELRDRNKIIGKTWNKENIHKVKVRGKLNGATKLGMHRTTIGHFDQDGLYAFVINKNELKMNKYGLMPLSLESRDRYAYQGSEWA